MQVSLRRNKPLRGVLSSPRLHKQKWHPVWGAICCLVGRGELNQIQ